MLPRICARIAALGLDMKLAGWPIQIQQGAIASAGGTLTGKSLPAPLRIGALNASVSRGGIDFAPADYRSHRLARPRSRQLSVQRFQASGEPRNSFVLRGSVIPRADGVFRWPPDWNFSIEGATSRTQDWLALSGALAQPVNSGWTAAGGLAVKMRGAQLAESSAAPWLGTMDFLGLTLSPAYVNQPLRLAESSC